MSKLIVLSNRVNLPKSDNTQAGGLAVALQDALQDIGGIWAVSYTHLRAHET